MYLIHGYIKSTLFSMNIILLLQYFLTLEMLTLLLKINLTIKVFTMTVQRLNPQSYNRRRLFHDVLYDFLIFSVT